MCTCIYNFVHVYIYYYGIIGAVYLETSSQAVIVIGRNEKRQVFCELRCLFIVVMPASA